MLILGEGGTGKSLDIDAITETFAHHKQLDLLAKCGTSGIASSNIKGQTIHSWAGIGVRTSKADNWFERATEAIKSKRSINILGIEFLIIDEISMFTKTLMFFLSGIIGTSRGSEGKGGASDPFGGMHVILCGDFHQFPPVASQGALYRKDEKDTARAKIGQDIYHQFDTVVILRQQMRVIDQVWIDILKRLRVGECTKSDLEEIEKLVLTSPNCDIPDFTMPPWDECILITPRHAVRERWNEAAVKRHCKKTGNILYIAPAEDFLGSARGPLPLSTQVAVAGLPEKKTGKLCDLLELAIGMKVMVTANIATEADVANGTQGTITEILLDSREPPLSLVEGIVHLKYPPAMVLFQPDKGTDVVLPGIPIGQLPLTPATETFSITISKPNSQTFRIRRRQFQLTPAYAFTDYKSQGQTLGAVIVDIGKSFVLTPFHVYVALSRSKGRQNIRLLRDFKEELFTTHPSESLRLEMIRLESLDAKTKERVAAQALEL